MTLERPDVYVVARFLERLRTAERPYGRSQLQMAVRLNYTLFKKYLAWLEAHDMVAIVPMEKGAERVVLTQKGARTYERLTAALREFVDGHDLTDRP